MLKRIIALFLVCILAIPIFAVPASASTTIGPVLTGAFDNEIAGYLYDLWKYFTVIDENHWMVKLREMLEDAWDGFWGDTKYAISVLVAEYMPRLDTTLENIFNKLDAFKTEVKSDFNSAIAFLLDIKNLVNDGFTNVNTWILNQTTALMQGFNEVYLHFIDHKNTMVDWFTEVRDEIVDTREYILNYLSELFTGEDGPSPDGFNESMDGQETQFDEMVDTMETAPTVDVDEVGNSLDVLSNIAQSETDAFYFGVLSQCLGNPVLQPIFIICGLLCILGYLLFGKR